MNDKNEINYNLSDLTKVFCLLFIIMLSLSSIYVFYYTIISNIYYYGFVLIPMFGIILVTIYYLKIRSPVKSLIRLILIEAIILLLYLSCTLLVILVWRSPLTSPIGWFLSYFYHYGVYSYCLLLPLIGIIALIIDYQRTYSLVERKKFSVVLILMGLNIAGCIVIISLLVSLFWR